MRSEMAECRGTTEERRRGCTTMHLPRVSLDNRYLNDGRAAPPCCSLGLEVGEVNSALDCGDVPFHFVIQSPGSRCVEFGHLIAGEIEDFDMHVRGAAQKIPDVGLISAVP